MTTFDSPQAPAASEPGRGQPAPPAPQVGTRNVGGGIICLIAGFVFLVTGLVMGTTGVLLQVIDDTWRRNGYLTSDGVRLVSPSYAIATEPLDMEDPDPSWPDDLRRLGSIRVSVSGTDGQAVFIGIAPADRVSAYLAGVRHATLTELVEPSTQYTEHPGGPPTSNPAEETFWTTSASGTGTQHLEWPREAGTWMAVVMNADSSLGVDVNAEIGAAVPLQQRATVGLLIGSVPVTVIGVLVLVLGARLLRRRRPATIPAA